MEGRFGSDVSVCPGRIGWGGASFVADVPVYVGGVGVGGDRADRLLAWTAWRQLLSRHHPRGRRGPRTWSVADRTIGSFACWRSVLYRPGHHARLGRSRGPRGA